MEPARPADWPHPDSLDALTAAPDSHRVLIDNQAVRVVQVVIPPRVREPAHTHRWPSVMQVYQPARIRYYGEDGSLLFESPHDFDPTPREPAWMEPEGPHSVENVDTRPYLAYRIELKVVPPRPWRARATTTP